MTLRKQKKTGSASEPKSKGFRFEHTAGAIELFLVAKRAAEHLASDGSISDRRIHDQNLIAIVFSALAVEGFLNDISTLSPIVFQNGEWYSLIDRDSRLQSLRRVMALAENANLQALDKLKLAHEVLGKPIDSGRAPIQDYQLLKKLRDAIAHPKPSNTTVIEDQAATPKLIKFISSKQDLLQALHSRGLLAKDPSSRGQGFLYWLDGTGLAGWAVETASAVVTMTIEALPPGDFRQGVTFVFKEFFVNDEARWKKLIAQDNDK